jgi:hypothetical protein
MLLAVPAIAWMWTESASAISALGNYLPPGSLTHQIGGVPTGYAAARNRIAKLLLQLAKSHGLESRPGVSAVDRQ